MTSFHFLTGERKLRRKGEQTSNRSVSYTQHRLDTELLWPPALLAKQRPLLKRRSRKKKLKTFWASQKFLGPSENPATPQATGKTGYNLHIPVPLSYVNVRPYAMMVGRWLYSSHRSEPSLTGKGLRTQWWIDQTISGQAVTAIKTFNSMFVLVKRESTVPIRTGQQQSTIQFLTKILLHSGDLYQLYTWLKSSILECSDFQTVLTSGDSPPISFWELHQF